MKANRKFVNADEAVSPVIAVILMVAITVVLAATVFVLVSDIGSNTSKNAPQMGWTDSETNDEWQVSQAPNQVEWTSFQIRMTGAGGYMKVALNTEPVTLVGQEVTAAYVALDATEFPGFVAGGDTLMFCSTALETNVKVTLLHTESNAIAHEFTFVSLPANAACVA